MTELREKLIERLTSISGDEELATVVACTLETDEQYRDMLDMLDQGAKDRQELLLLALGISGALDEE